MPTGDFSYRQKVAQEDIFDVNNTIQQTIQEYYNNLLDRHLNYNIFETVEYTTTYTRDDKVMNYTLFILCLPHILNNYIQQR